MAIREGKKVDEMDLLRCAYLCMEDNSCKLKVLLAPAFLGIY